MFGRRFVTICHEGFYYIFVLAFVIGGATLRDINLLFVLAGIMIGPLLVNWRLVVMAMRRLEIVRRLPSKVHAGRPFRVEITGHNHRRRLGSWMIVVEDSVAAVHERSSRKERRFQKGIVVLPFIAARSSEASYYRVTLPRRGEYRFGNLQVSTRFPLGLVKSSMRIKQPERLIVFPKLGRLTGKWTRLLESDRWGRQQAHRRQGPIDGDYYGLREWRPGDSKRWIHWRTSAKLDRLMVLQFEQQQNRDVALVLDLWQPEQPNEEDQVRVEQAVSLAATILDEVSRRGNSRMMIVLAGSEQGRWIGSTGSHFASRMMERLALIGASSENHLPEMLADSLPDVPHGARVVVVSTRQEDLAALLESQPMLDKPRQQRAVSEIVWLDVGNPRLEDVFLL